MPLLGALATIGVEPGDQLPGWLWAPWAECPSDQSLGMDLNLAWLAPGLVALGEGTAAASVAVEVVMEVVMEVAFVESEEWAVVMGGGWWLWRD